MSKNDLILAAGSVGLVIFGAYIVKGINEFHQVKKRLDNALNDISDKTDIEISEEIIEEAVRERVHKEVYIAVKKAADQAARDIESDMKKQIKQEIDEEYENLSASVKKKIHQEVDDINIERLKKEVVAEAKEAAANKFETELDDVLEKYNENLSKITQIYGSIAQSMNPKQAFTF